MLPVKFIKIRNHEKGLYFRDREFKGILNEGRHWFFDPLMNVQVTTVSLRNPWFSHEALDIIVKSGALVEHAKILDLKDHQRGLVWVEGRFQKVIGPGLYALWTAICDVHVEVIDAEEVLFHHKDLNVIVKSEGVDTELNVVMVEHGFVGLYFKDGVYVQTLSPGQYMFWKKMAKVKVFHVDMREGLLDISGQELMTADKVTLRMNAILNYRVIDALKFVSVADDGKQALYRDMQLALRAVIGTYDLDRLLTEKELIAKDLEATIKERAAEFGIKVESVGIRDLILPGEMKDLMNRVIEAKKAADANLIMRREETAAMRSQANTAKLLENNPTLMRLRELDLLEKIAANNKLNIVLGEKGLADRVVNLL
jgi:regulator of protease activity HflC (stomatin/prohibitin superfamily)